MFTIAITTYNRLDLVIDSFSSVLDNELIDEIVIVDDCSEDTLFNNLKNKLDELKSDKIKLYRNESNLKPLMNKLEAVKHSKNEWVILLDSDNKLNDNYIDTIKNIGKDKNTLYIPEKLLHFNGDVISDFSNYKDYEYSIDNIKLFLDKPEITTALNVGNFLVNRDTYINLFLRETIEYDLQTNDAFYFSYLWIKSNNRIKIVGGLNYFHRQHDNSWYLNNRSLCDNNTKEIINRLKHL